MYFLLSVILEIFGTWGDSYFMTATESLYIFGKDSEVSGLFIRISSRFIFTRSIFVLAHGFLLIVILNAEEIR